LFSISKPRVWYYPKYKTIVTRAGRILGDLFGEMYLSYHKGVPPPEVYEHWLSKCWTFSKNDLRHYVIYYKLLLKNGILK